MADLQIDQVTKTFGDTQVLKGISLDIADGEFVSLVGPSGCGKSTLLRIIAGLEGQTSGAIRIHGQDVSGIRAADRNLSMVFQSYALYPHLTVAENISVPLKMRQLSAVQRLPVIGPFLPGSRDKNVEIAAAVKHAAQTLEIDKLLDRKPGQLSGGQRQRVALGRALVREPAAFLLDEPLSNLDAKLRVQTRAEIAELHRRIGATFVYVTHDQVEAMTMSSRIAVMMDGEILQCDAPDEVYHNPLDIRVAEFIGSPKINILPTEASGGVLRCGDVLLPTLAPNELNGPVLLGLRPEALRLASEDAVLKGQVAHVENLGSEIFAQISLVGQEGRVTLRATPVQRRSLRIGANVGIAFEGRAALLFDSSGKRVFNPHLIPAHSEVA
ncbi:carbohydrate ABC transporter ATP-binding protein, CUT1 family [Thalassococcus halodurans]|uniref:Carbohydrate ABC transporter ATP-binding protein, CUT1 family n=1 Tax=Thalassococcus halodurans TaxID=373675 RepID=A0A1H6B1M6_9RHOB|nr:ABC transporter ATP-binding protein [Thalassococcus halodurans]MEE2810971.1 ABC transporter ATP-binding protein [Pseudomonadota bacterium]SEG54510.1 carbohydrate ABC transporter ATP-binding protein, CUT1 family [Thalassococcus halodurans]